MREKNELISCLCITDKRVNLLSRSIDCFRNQTYANKELIILYNDYDYDTSTFVNSIDDENIKCFKIDSNLKLSLGAKRNLSLEKSNGTYFCNWDDDDWHHSERLNLQFKALRENHKEASILINVILYDCKEKQAYFSFSWPWEGTLLCDKSFIREFKYGDIDKGEDSYLISHLLDNNFVYPVIKPTLYIYTIHGQNTWDYNHFRSFFLRSQKLSPKISSFVKGVLENEYTYAKASKLLFEAGILNEIDYFKWDRKAIKKIICKSQNSPF
ncbi:MAG: glycosyltransferase family 2 protein [Cytophagales bacterium]|nr:glycosyltransferase family 2 protein [Cytophagales bacterium]